MAAISYREKWPLTVNRGELMCEPVSRVIFRAPNGTEYGVNGAAVTAGYLEIDPIWAANPDSDPSFPTKKSIGPLITNGLKLCK